jgi:Tropinone reductase 1
VVEPGWRDSAGHWRDRGSNGIGHAIVEELPSLGAQVHTCSRNAAELEECRRRWAEEKGLQVTVSVCDVGVRTEREQRRNQRF